MRLSRAPTLLLVAGALSLAAVALGAWVCAQSDVPTALWARNLAAWAVGAAAAVAISRAPAGRLFPSLLVATVVALAATLVSPGQLGVHRWIAAGPVSFNVALLMAPAAVVAVAATRRLWSWALALVALALLAVQPDLSQAMALGGALVLILLRTSSVGVAVRAAGVVMVLALVARAAVRPDPLEPVREVELILQLAYALSPALAVAAFAAVLATAAAPMALSRASDARTAGEALSLYLLITAVMPFVGAFPLPLVGVGLSPVLGVWLAAGALAAALRAEAALGAPHVR